MSCSLPGSSVRGIFQAIVLGWIAISFSRGSSRPRDQTRVPHIVDRCLTVWATREVLSTVVIYFSPFHFYWDIMDIVPRWPSGKEFTCWCRRQRRCTFNPWVRKIPWNRKCQPTLVSLPREPHGQRSLAGYSPRGHRESDITEHTYNSGHTTVYI